MKFLFAVLALSIPVATAAAGPDDAPAPPHDRLGVPRKLAPGTVEYLDGLEKLGAGRIAEAEAALGRAVAADGSRVEYRRAHGLALLLAERLPEGTAEIRAAAGGRRDPETAMLLAFALRLRGDMSGAMQAHVPKARDPWDQLLLKVGYAYGQVAMVAGTSSASTAGMFRKEQDEARARFPVVAKMFAEQASVAGGDIGRAQFAAGYARFVKRDFAGAEPAFRAALNAYPTDATVIAYHAMSLSGIGRREQGRRGISTALCWLPALPVGYLHRGLVAARMGSIDRANADLAIIRRLDPKGETGFAAQLAKVIAESEKAMPEEPPAKLFDGLLAAARAGEDDAKLVRRATWLAFAANRHRRIGDETYQDARRDLEWRLRAEPQSPDRLADLAHFLVDEVDVRTERVEPGTHAGLAYREQTPALKKKELETADGLCRRALGVDANHAGALLGLARIAVREGRFADAENLLKRALASDPTEPRALELMSYVLEVAADQKTAAAFALRMPERWSEVVGRWRYHYVRYPSAAELRRADRYDRMAAGFLQRGTQLARQAILAARGKPEGHDFAGALAWRGGNFAGARTHWTNAVRADPGNRGYRYSLANACSRLGLTKEWLEQTNAGRNLEHTTASAWLWHAWDRIVGRDWDGAAASLRSAVNVDPADPRVAAYLGIVAAGRGDVDGAVEFLRAALAQCGARAWYRGMRDVGDGALPVAETGLAMAIRLRLGELVAVTDPAAAAKLFLENVALEPRVGDLSLSAAVPTALLPDVRPGSLEIPSTPIAAALFRESRARAAIALSDAGRHRDAVEQFRALAGYRKRLDNAQANLDGGDVVTVSPPTWLAAITSLEAIGERTDAWAWLMLARRYFELTAGGQGDPLRPLYDTFKARIPRPAGVRDMTYSQRGSDEYRAANAPEPSMSVDDRRRNAASWARWAELQLRRVETLPEAERAAARARVLQQLEANVGAPIPTPARRAGFGGRARGGRR